MLRHLCQNLLNSIGSSASLVIPAQVLAYLVVVEIAYCFSLLLMLKVVVSRAMKDGLVSPSF